MRRTIGVVGSSGGPLETGELAIAHDEGRLIGVLKGSGGITDLVEEIIRVSETEQFRKASRFCDSRAETA